MKVPTKSTPGVLPEGPATPAQTSSAQDSDFGIIGHALSRAGSALERGEEGIDKLKAQRDETAVNDLYSNGFSPKFRDLYQQYYALQGKDAIDQRPAFEEKMKTLQQEARNGLGNRRQQNMFDSMSRRRVEMELDGMARYSDQQDKVWAGETHDATLKTLRNQAADKFNDERSFGTALGTGQAEIDRYAIRSGKSAEWARAQMQTFQSNAAIDRVSRWALQDPLAANAWYQENQNMIDAQQRPVIEHHLKSAVLPVEAKSLAEGIIAGGQLNPSKEGAALIPVAADQDTMATGQPAPQNKRDTRGMLGNWVATAEAAATRLHPNDPVFRDLVVTQVKGYVNTIVAAQDGIARQAHATLMQAALGDGKTKPFTLSDLLSNDERRGAWALADPQSQRGILALLEHNVKAANGELRAGNPALFNRLRSAAWLPDGDPNKLTTPAQITQYFADGKHGSGLNETQGKQLREEIAAANNPDGNAFLKDVNRIKQRAHTMLTKSMTAQVQPDLAEEAAERFSQDLDARIKQYRANPKMDPRSLITSGSSDYVLDPARVASFMPGTRDVVRDKADAARASAKPGEKPQEAPKPTEQYPTAYNPTTKETMILKGGKWQKQ